jgi:hypothetical protein
MNKPNESANYGIVGNVNAKAVAVGSDATAIVNETVLPSRAEFEAAVAALRDQIATLQLPEHSREILHEDVTKIEGVTDTPEAKPRGAELLKGLVDKLKMVGIVVEGITGLAEPIRKLAAWFQISIPF